MAAARLSRFSSVSPLTAIVFVAMSVLMVASDAGWPSDREIGLFAERVAAGGRPVTVVASRNIVGADFGWRRAWTSAAALPWLGGGGGGVRLLLTGFRDPRLAALLRRECGADVPVYAAIPADDDPDGRLFDAFDSVPGVAAFRCPMPADRSFGVLGAALVRLVGRLSDAYRSHVEGLRDIPSAGPEVPMERGDAYSAAMDAFEDGGGVRSVGPVLDAVLDQLCGAEPAAEAEGDGRWMTTLIEDGNRAAEDASRLSRSGCRPAAAADHQRRATRTALSFAASFWRDVAGPPPTSADRALAACLIEQIRTAAGGQLADLPAEKFVECLNARFADTRRWRSGPTTGRDVPLFRPEIRERMERFTGAGHLAELMAVGDADGERVFSRSHVEYLEPHVLSQRLAEHTSRHHHRQVRYFSLADSLVFRFTDGERRQVTEQNYKRRLTGSKSFKRFHDELFRDLHRLTIQ